MHNEALAEREWISLRVKLDQLWAQATADVARRNLAQEMLAVSWAEGAARARYERLNRSSMEAGRGDKGLPE